MMEQAMKSSCGPCILETRLSSLEHMLDSIDTMSAEVEHINQSNTSKLWHFTRIIALQLYASCRCSCSRLRRNSLDLKRRDRKVC
jgi:hypothetical protein